MRGPDVWQAMLAAMEADAALTAVVGEAIYLEGEREFEVPSLTGLMIVGTQDERFAPVDFQLDVYARTMADAVAASDALVALFDHDVRTTVGGMRCWSQVIEEREFRGPERSRVSGSTSVPAQYYRRSLDIRVTPIRRRYVRVAES